MTLGIGDLRSGDQILKGRTVFAHILLPVGLSCVFFFVEFPDADPH